MTTTAPRPTPAPTSTPEAALDGDRVARRMTRGFAALSTGRAITLLLQLIAFASVAHFLGPAGVGAYTFALAFYGLFAFVTNFGIRLVVTRDISQEPDQERDLVTNLFYLRILLGLLAYACLLGGLWLGGYSDLERQAGLIAGIMLILLAVESFQIVLEVRLRTGWVSIAAVVQGIILAVGSLIIGPMGAGVAGFLWLYVLAGGVNFVIIAVAGLAAAPPLSWRPEPRLWWRVARAAAYLGLAQLCITLYYRLDLLVLAAWKSPEAVGQYGAAYRFLETFVVVPSLAMTVLAPVIARSVVSGTRVLQRRYARLMHLIALASFPVGVAGALTAWRVLPVIPGFREFEGAGVALSILAPAATCIFFGNALSSVLVSGHRQRSLLAVSAAGLVLNIGLNVVLIPPFSYVGAAVATTITEVAMVSGLMFMIARHLDVRWPGADVLRALRASLVMAGVLALGFVLPPLVQLGLGLVAYVLALLPTRSLVWADFGGLFHGEGSPGVVTFGAGEKVGPVATLRALQGANGATLVGVEGSAVPRWAPVVARFAGCDPVQVDAATPNPRWWRWFVTAPSP